jgi:hypothetical protein
MLALMSMTSDRHRTATLRELDDARLADHFAGRGDTCIATAPLDRPIEVHGEVREVRIVPTGVDARFEAEVADGTATLLARWSGEVRPTGVKPGAQVRLLGAIEADDESLLMQEPVVEESWPAHGAT